MRPSQGMPRHDEDRRGRDSSFALSGTDMRLHPAPAFSLKDQNGAMVSLSSLRGRVIVLRGRAQR